MSETTRPPALSVGDVWVCDESKATGLPEPWDRPYEAAGMPPWARFRIEVRHVESDYIEAVVTNGNPHPRTPPVGSRIATTTKNLRENPRWSEREGGT